MEEELDITGTYEIGSELYYTIEYDEASGLYRVWNPYLTGADAYITAERTDNTLTLSLDGITADFGDSYGVVTIIMCACHPDPSDPSGTSYLWPLEPCVWEFSDATVTLTNGLFLGFQNPSDKLWYNWDGSVQAVGTVGVKVESRASSMSAGKPSPVVGSTVTAK